MEMKIIDEILEDKQQIITYKMLAKMLKIHPNKSKELLKNYVHKKSTNKIYSVTIIIGGLLKENNNFNVLLVHADHVETMRRQFKNISFEHIYSVQPIGRLKDMSNDLFLIEKPENSILNISSSIRKNFNSKIIHNTLVVESFLQVDSCRDKMSQLKENEEKKDIPVENKSNILTNKKGINDFFNTTQVRKSKCESIISNSKVETNKRSPTDFFTKFKNPNVKNDNKICKEEPEKKENLELNIELISTDIDDKEEQKIPSKKNVKKNSCLKKKNDKKERKRIQTFDSSDEDEKDSEEEDNKRSQLITNDEDFIQPTPPRPTPRENRKKEKKVTTTTIIDDDGFVCTSKEVQFVETEIKESNFELSEYTDTDTGEYENKAKKFKPDKPEVKIQLDKKKNQSKCITKNTTLVQDKKQSSLTNFFTKK